MKRWSRPDGLSGRADVTSRQVSLCSRPLLSRRLFDFAKVWSSQTIGPTLQYSTSKGQWLKSQCPTVAKVSTVRGSRGRRSQRSCGSVGCMLVLYGPLNYSRERLGRRRTAFKLQCISVATLLLLILLLVCTSLEVSK